MTNVLKLIFLVLLSLRVNAISLEDALSAPARRPHASVTEKQPGVAFYGALVGVRIQSKVGVLIDDFPSSMQKKIIDQYLKKPESFWEKKARQQVEATLYRLVYRNFYYEKRGKLPLPPKKLWSFYVRDPAVVTIDGHKLVAVEYTFNATLLTSIASLIETEPVLANIGNIWEEPFVLPADPDLLLERTGMACTDESGFPSNSVDSENARNFFDHTCQGGKNICHVSQPYPQESCSDALQKKIGRVPTVVQFERLAWDSRLADKVRISNSQPNSDLAVLQSGLENNRLIYRYIPPNSCAIQESCVSGSGWRRLLQFDASVSNQGQRPIHLGDVSPNSVLVKQNMFEFSECHGHYHFSHYGKFTVGIGKQQLGSKRAFCLESTSRYANSEMAPLTHPYTCEFQGIEAGWGDDYIAGIECQWVDVTDVTDVAGPTHSVLAFQSNPDQFLCEGNPRLDASGNFTFVATDFKTEKGEIQNRVACDFSNDWNANNYSQVNFELPAQGSYVTAPCNDGQDSPLRNCGFKVLGSIKSCKPGEIVKLSCLSSSPTTVRVCEASHVLGVGTACTYREALNNSVVESAGSHLNFKCPAARDSNEPGGKFALYLAAVHEGDSIGKVVCN